MTKRFWKTALITCLASSCGHDKECVPPALEEQIVGTWNAEFVSESGAPQEITFEKSGKFNESKGLLFGVYLKSEGNWRVKKDSLIVEGKFSNGKQTTFEFSVISRTCNEILFDLEGAEQMKLIQK
ncbi:hypothetical protein [Dyadobacter sp. 676]|uniref:Lipocalin family protein n=1 Tax=Dyadobacter sp. 676 TaxID=3088362 RepID=A0AAU8FNK2_9BACT